jgi:hypothetical protein
MPQRILISFIILGLLVLFGGCSETTTSSGDNPQSDDFDGYTPTDEAAFFGDSYMMTEMGEDSSFDDPMVENADVKALIDDPNSGVFALRIIWGSLEYDSTVTEVTDWSGSLAVSYGAILIKRLIRFEPGQDYIKPRTSRDSVEWVSKTTVHNDGILVFVYVPPSTTTDIKTITFGTGPFTKSFEISDLIKLDTVFALDDSVNSVAFRAFKIQPHGNMCPKGFLEGRWGRDSTGQGIFFGRWISQHGLLAGHLRGRWGRIDINGDELSVFYGKYIDITGRFKGLVRGIYMPHPSPSVDANCCPPHGKFYGFFHGANGVVQGVLKGHYRMPPSDSDRKMGYFGGRWKAYCNGNAHAEDARDGMDDNL